MKSGLTHRNVAVLIPSFEEFESLRNILPRLNAVLRQMNDCAFSVYVVTEMQPSEGTIRFLETQRVKVVKRSPTNSFGDAIRSGIAAIPEAFELTIIMDADGSHSPETIPKLLTGGDDFDVVVASRYVPGGSSDNGVVLRLMSRALNWTYSLVLGIDCKDVSTNFKRYRTIDLKSIELTSSNFDAVEEILIRIAQRRRPMKLRILEIPDHFSERVAGISKRKLSVFIASYILTLVRLRLETMRNP
jgi:dolichol-phosphate mannosyltransferase